MSKRSKEDTIKYFKLLAFEFRKTADRDHSDEARGKAEAYEVAAFELERNME